MRQSVAGVLTRITWRLARVHVAILIAGKGAAALGARKGHRLRVDEIDSTRLDTREQQWKGGRSLKVQLAARALALAGARVRAKAEGLRVGQRAVVRVVACWLSCLVMMVVEVIVMLHAVGLHSDHRRWSWHWLARILSSDTRRPDTRRSLSRDYTNLSLEARLVPNCLQLARQRATFAVPTQI